MSVGVIGINHKLANLHLREQLAHACQRFFVTAGSVHESHTFIILNTCNRTEIYFASDDLTAAHSFLLQILRLEVRSEFDQKVYSFFGYDCFLHLARVTAGLDSAIVAETEIQGQVKGAYENACKCLKLPAELHYLFQKALKIGKEVRSSILLGRGMPDLEHAIYQTGMHYFKESTERKVLLIGASSVNNKILDYLISKNLKDITLCNRTEHAVSQQVQILPWSKLGAWSSYNWIICATKAPHYLLKAASLPQNARGNMLIMDLSVPRNVDPLLGRDKRVTLLNIDQINRILKVRQQKMSHLLTEAEELAKESVNSSFHNFKIKLEKKLSLVI